VGPSDEISVEPRTGRALVFDHGIEHQGAPVVAGVKYVLRTDLMFRR
jgi:prolyl 4-hydroxylase